MNTHAIPNEKLLAEVERHQWAHSIDLGDGVATKGSFGPPDVFIMHAFDQVDFNQKKVLDIGCWDGLWSFEAERRGAAEVYATDEVSQRGGLGKVGGGRPTFVLAHQILRSRAAYHPTVSVYNVEQLNVRDFDIVLFCGVYYHLKHPVLALSRLRKVMKEGGTIIVEGAVIEDSSETLALFSHKKTQVASDPSNWWIPTIPCLREWVESSFFDIIYERKSDGLIHPSNYPGTITRYTVVAKAVRRADPNYIYPDDELRSFDLNAYSLVGYLDHCSLVAPGEMYLEGWAADLEAGVNVEEIQIIVDGHLLERCGPNRERPDVAAALHKPEALLSGWSCKIRETASGPNSTVVVKAINDRKFERILAVGTRGELLKRPRTD